MRLTLDALAVLDAIDRQGSFAAAAEELHRVPSAMTYAVQKLEADLDVLLFDDLRYHEHGLTIPHPQMHLRAFVLRPLLEIAPDCVIPGVGPVKEALQECRHQKLEMTT